MLSEYDKIEIDKIYKMLDSDAKLIEIYKKIWECFHFYQEHPLYNDDLPSIGYRFYDKFKNDSTNEALAYCMLLLGRIFDVKGEALPACRFFLQAMRLFKSDRNITAMEFFREKLRGEDGEVQIGLSKSQFKSKYHNDTPERLVKEYFTGHSKSGL